MQLGRFSVSTLRPASILSINYSEDGKLFTIASETGYEVWRTWPLALVRRKVLPGTLARVVLLPASPLLVLQGGGAAPLYSPNKAVIYHDKLGMAIAELEFGERIRGITARNGTICIALSRKVAAFEYGVNSESKDSTAAQSSNNPFAKPAVKGKGKDKAVETGFWLRKIGEWETAENELGLMAISKERGSTLLALPGRQAGHVQLVHLSPCPPPSTGSNITTANPFRSPIILAHTHALSTLSCTSTGSHIITTSERGTLLRVWDTGRGRLERELRRGVDRAEMWGVQMEDGGRGRVAGWSDKGTVHVWAEEDSKTGKEGTRSSTSTNAASLGQLLSRNLPLPKYFSSTASVAQYHLPRKNPHAFSAALGAAGVNVPSMRADEDQGELSERFVVGWVEVDVPLTSEEGAEGKESKGKYGPTGNTPLVGGIGMGSREERHSFGSGSDNTSRTATPTMSGRRSDTPTQVQGQFTPSRGRRGSMLSNTTTASSRKPSYSQSTSNNLIQVTKDGLSGRGRTGTPHVKIKSSHSRTHSQGQVQGRVKTKKEKQLVAITYSGDWYRLKVSPNTDEDKRGEEDAGESKQSVGSECELSEYRRLGVGGGGW